MPTLVQYFPLLEITKKIVIRLCTGQIVTQRVKFIVNDVLLSTAVSNGKFGSIINNITFNKAAGDPDIKTVTLNAGSTIINDGAFLYRIGGNNPTLNLTFPTLETHVTFTGSSLNLQMQVDYNNYSPGNYILLVYYIDVTSPTNPLPVANNDSRIGVFAVNLTLA